MYWTTRNLYWRITDILIRKYFIEVYFTMDKIIVSFVGYSLVGFSLINSHFEGRPA